MNTFLSFMPIIIDGIVILLMGILIIAYDKEPDLKESHGQSTGKNKHNS